MKNKIVFLLVFTVIFNTSFVYADTTENISLNDIPEDQSKMIEEYISDYSSEDGNIYFSDYGRVVPRSGTAVAIGGAVASSILALATKAGISFLSTNAMDEFLYRFTGIPSAQSLLPSISNSIKNSINGVVSFSRSLLDTISGVFFDVVSAKDISFYKTGDMTIPVWSSSVKWNESNWVNVSRLVTGGISVNDDFGASAQKEFDVLGHKYRIKLSSDSSSYEYISASVQRWDSSTQKWTTSASQYIYAGDTAYAFPVLKQYSSYYYIGVIFVYKSGINSVYRKAEGAYSTSVGRYNELDLLGESLEAVVGEGWSDGVINDDKGSSGVSIKIPSNAGQLVGTPSSGVTSAPSYDTWSPGVTVVIPGVDNPKVDITTDTPTDKPTDKPSTDSVISWDWLKNLLDLIKGLIQTIVDWLTNFWDNLLEFIKSIFVPSEGYFIDVFNDILSSIKEKIPGVDVSKLEQLAVGEQEFEDIYATFFGVKCLVIKGSIINRVVSWGRPIIQGIIALFLLLYNYNQIYFLFRGSRLSSNSSEKG